MPWNTAGAGFSPPSAFIWAAVRLALPRWGAGRMVLALTLLGIGTELAQFLVPGRHPRLSDVLVDVVAGLAGWAIAHALLRQR